MALYRLHYVTKEGAYNRRLLKWVLKYVLYIVVVKVY